MIRYLVCSYDPIYCSHLHAGLRGPRHAWPSHVRACVHLAHSAQRYFAWYEYSTTRTVASMQFSASRRKCKYSA